MKYKVHLVVGNISKTDTFKVVGYITATRVDSFVSFSETCSLRFLSLFFTLLKGKSRG